MNKNYGYPSPRGLTGWNDGDYANDDIVESYWGDVPEYYPHFKKALLKYVKS
jgi:hypothetical protein